MLPTGKLALTEAAVWAEVSSINRFEPLVWATLSEVEQFFLEVLPSSSFHRARVIANRVSMPSDTIPTFFPSREYWDNVSGKYRRTVDHERVAELVRSELRAAVTDSGDDRLLIITDQELTPPKDWSYIIWDGTSDASVISLLPLDPQYWMASRFADREIGATIKRRLRAACICSVGEWLGMFRCEDPECFLFRDIDNVDRLDSMLRLGSEHLRELPGIENRVGMYFTDSGEPEKVESLVQERTGGQYSA
jgi:hypothetical protein